ncbi:MAG: hypothetical protein QME94_19080 [Anaerolineae bacterium]|nr:hypothetical protein [Anaerolineae bacterium]
MDARPLLVRIAAALQKHRLEAVLLGNAAAALHGAPVTTIDFDFLFRKTATNLRKLKAVARDLGAVIFRPYYPPLEMYRVTDDDSGLQVDFMTAVHGVRSLASLRSRATAVDFGGATLLVASLRDIIRSKRLADRGKDRAVLPVLEEVLRVQQEG